MEKKHLNLDGVPETLLIPLYVKARATKEKHEKVNDQKAVEIIDSIDYDFSKFNNSKMTYYGVLARTIIFDREMKKFIEENPNAIIISIGCGFDTRFTRMDNGQIDWYNLDVPEVIEYRKHFFNEENDRVHSIAKSAWDFSWTDEIINESGRPLLIFIEGVLMFFSKEQVQLLFNEITKRFSGCYWICEFMSKFSVDHSSWHDSVPKVGCSFQWGISRGEEIEEMCPSLKMKGYWNLADECPFFWKILTKYFNDTIGFYHNE